MKINWTGQLQKNPRQVLNDAGYHEFRDPNTDKISYIMRLGRDYYPRMHVYITKDSAEGGQLDIHLDQKKASYEGQRAHSGEYEGPLVREEAERLQRWFIYYLQQQ